MKHQSAVQTERDQQAREQAGRAHAAARTSHASQYQQPYTPGVDGNLLVMADEPRAAFVRLHESHQQDARGVPPLTERVTLHLCREEYHHRRKTMVFYRTSLSPKQVASLLNLSPSRVRELVRMGKLDARRDGGVDGRIAITVTSFRQHLATAGYTDTEMQAYETRIADMTRIPDNTRN